MTIKINRLVHSTVYYYSWTADYYNGVCAYVDPPNSKPITVRYGPR